MSTARIIAVGADHAGYLLKDQLAQAARDVGWTVIDCGTNGPASVDYPDFAHAVSDRIEAGDAKLGLLVCGTGIGMALAANRHPAVRCAQVRDATETRLARQHNNANIIALGARLTGDAVALDCLTIFLTTDYEGGRHDRRLAKLNPPT
ncbi:MAG TPA: ribose 5-phosphate isomerase B [Acidiphilium sp.]|nr:MAG: ribose 5-phosphate isomerase B [Acidiphilium sp. 21-60-14]OYV92399.1 MAG: ribose 5-phosphate isomerase B [Acidiphilium sp. 37-60-79]OZB40168.1 MAG: ribose 5-phosphate isomerase B [Acidiphilium sp. 34-60-192]HQT87877.1 ribose 5-phosphate isomerase B [Acidiphilium sp.]HQU24874.1 ribose 5-phosphate isomerase B [Acidiphilium sp.]